MCTWHHGDEEYAGCAWVTRSRPERTTGARTTCDVSRAAGSRAAARHCSEKQNLWAFCQRSLATSSSDACHAHTLTVRSSG